MPAVPVYTASPVNAAKASGTTPQTAQPQVTQQSSSQQQQGPPSVPATTTASAGSQYSYPAAQPAAARQVDVPAVPSGVPQPGLGQQEAAPTPTQQTPSATRTQQYDNRGPAAPQPGATPIPPGAAAAAPTSQAIPPPPKAGETLQQQHRQPTATATAGSLPPQMSYPPPGSSPYGPAGTTATDSSSTGGPRPTSLYEGGPAASFSHPPGYQQDTYAAEFTSDQRAAHNAAVQQGHGGQHGLLDGSGGGDDDEGSVWGTAKKWATAAGNSLAAAENEVWRRINKD